MNEDLAENSGRFRVVHAVTASGTTRLMRGQLRHLREDGCGCRGPVRPFCGCFMIRISLRMPRYDRPIRGHPLSN
jgi:hypothetical protein